ncbi:ATP-binding cassette domain-containing protein [Actinoallomurus acaciae]|uniref:ATP-binding cassette domain-containing protein n=1 Tax=Actinoallomurus acaciae TaxID=502577 RepID=A0ABV5YAT7_9ACTN
MGANVRAAHDVEPRETLPLPPGPYDLRVADLRVRWPDGETVGLGDTELVLPAGRRVALVATGRVGTSALAAVLLRFIDYEGTATLSGVELRDLAGDDVRRVVGLCARDTHVLSATVAENVRVARPNASEDEVTAALRRAGLTLPPDTVVTDDATPGADRQRLALARALLADVPILVLEDPVAERDVRTAAEDRTLLLITHSTAVPGATPLLRHVDEVVTFEDRP